MNAPLRRGLVATLLLLLIAGAAYLIMSLLDPDTGSLDPMEVSTPAAGRQDSGISAVPLRARAAPGLRARDRAAQPSIQPSKQLESPAASAPVGTRLTVRDESGAAAKGASVAMAGSGWSAVIGESAIVPLPNDASSSTVSVSGPNFETVQLVHPTGEVLVVLEGTGVLTGYVRDLNGVAVTGASVFVARQGNTTPVPDRPEWTAETGSDGAFRLTRLPPGFWEVWARLDAQGGRPAMKTSQSCSVPATPEVILVLGRALDIRGRLTGPDGELPPGKLSVVMRGVRPDGGNGAAWTGTIAKDGTFVIPNVASGSNLLWAWTSDRSSQLALTILHDVQPGTADLHIALVRGDVIQGRLVDDQGEPVKGGGGVNVFDGGVLVNGVRMTQGGTFCTHLLPRDRLYDLTLTSASGWSGTLRGLVAGTSDVVVRGRKRPPLTGNVLLPDGSPAGAGVVIQVRGLGITAKDWPGAALGVRTDADGRFSIPNLGDFLFVVTASDGGKYAPARVPGTVRPGAHVQLRLQAPQPLMGRVLLASSQPAVGMELWVLPQDGAFRGWRLQTDASGEFHMAKLPAGAVRIMLDTLHGPVQVGRAVVPARDVLITLPAR